MRRRKKKGADIKLLSYTDCVFHENVEEMAGKWHERFGNENPIHIEVGTGKGQFITTLAELNPDKNYIAMEIKEEVLLHAVYKAKEKGLTNILFIWGDVKMLPEYFDVAELSRIYVNFCDPWPKNHAVYKAKEKGLTNILFIWGDVKMLPEYFDVAELSRIYVNFCDPWPKNRWAKRRLTHSDFLNIYRRVLDENGEIHFKTDNEKLFEFSLNEIAENDWKLKNISLDLANSNYEGNVTTENGEIHFKTDNEKLFEFSLNEIAENDWKLKNISLDLANSNYEGNVTTEYEDKFMSQGMKIYRLEAEKLKNISLDLANSNYEGNVTTEYEDKFMSQGMKIYRLEAEKRK